MAKSYTLSTEGAKRSARWCNGTRRGCNCTQCTRLTTGLYTGKGVVGDITTIFLPVSVIFMEISLAICI